MKKESYKCVGCEIDTLKFLEILVENECKCCKKIIESYYLCSFCKLIPMFHPLCLSCKNRGCYFDSPCYLGDSRKLNNNILMKILRSKIFLVYRISQLYYKTRNRIYLPGSNVYNTIKKEYYTLAMQHDININKTNSYNTIK